MSWGAQALHESGVKPEAEVRATSVHRSSNDPIQVTARGTETPWVPWCSLSHRCAYSLKHSPRLVIHTGWEKQVYKDLCAQVYVSAASRLPEHVHNEGQQLEHYGDYNQVPRIVTFFWVDKATVIITLLVFFHLSCKLTFAHPSKHTLIDWLLILYYIIKAFKVLFMNVNLIKLTDRTLLPFTSIQFLQWIGLKHWEQLH